MCMCLRVCVGGGWLGRLYKMSSTLTQGITTCHGTLMWTKLEILYLFWVVFSFLIRFYNLCPYDKVTLVMSDSLLPYGLQPARLLCPWGLSRQEYWSGLLCPPPGDLSYLGIEPRSPALQAASLPLAPLGKPH